MSHRVQAFRLIGAAMLLTGIPHIAGAASPADMYLDADFWQRMEWQEAPSSALWQQEGWAPFEGQQAERLVFTQERSLNLLGQEFTARLGYDRSAVSYEYISALYAEVSRSQCEPQSQALVERFGEPIAHDGTVALPIAENTFMRIIALSYQWDIGDTRLTATCFGFVNQHREVETEDGKFTWSMRYTHRSVTEKIAPKFGLTCTRTLTYAVSGDSRQVSDLVLWIDLYRSRVLGIDLVVLSDEDSLIATTGDIRFSMTRKGLLTDYTINRVTGALTATISEEDQRVGTLMGKCEKSQALTRKF